MPAGRAGADSPSAFGVPEMLGPPSSAADKSAADKSTAELTTSKPDASKAANAKHAEQLKAKLGR